MRRGPRRGGGRERVGGGAGGRGDGLPKQRLTWRRLRAVNFLKVTVCMCACGGGLHIYIYIFNMSVYICHCKSVCFPQRGIIFSHNVPHISKRFCRSEPAGITVASVAPALGGRGGGDGIKTHHNAAVISP